MDDDAPVDAAQSRTGEPSSRASGGDVRTFLIADVRGYTSFTQEHGDDAAAALAQHFAKLARAAVAERDGEVIELRGDEALAVFSSARQALRAAVDLQRNARTQKESAFPLGIGVGLDAGEAVPLEGGYRGGALNLAARLCGLAKPGEILVSETVVGLARKVDGLHLVKRRPARLKGLEEPVPVIEAVPDPPLPPLQTQAPPRRSFARRHKWLLLGAAVVAACLAVALPLLLISTERSHPPETLASIPRSFFGLVRVDPKTKTWNVLKRIRLPGNFGEGGGAIAAGSMWFSGSTGIDRVDPDTGRVIAHIPVTGGGGGLSGSTREGIWFASHAPDDDAIWGIDVLKNNISQHVPLPGKLFAGPYVGEGFVWAASANRIWKIRPSDGRIIATIPFDFPFEPANNAAAVGEGALWIADPTQLQARPGHFGVVARIDAKTNHIVRIPVTRPNGVAAGGGAVWARSGTDVENPGTGNVTEINPSTDGIVRTIALRHADWVTAGDLGVLVTDARKNAETLINPATGKVINHIVLPRGFGFLGEWNGSFWLERLESH